jgi:hypothetical protein
MGKNQDPGSGINMPGPQYYKLMKVTRQAYLAERQQVRPAHPAVPVQHGVVTDKQRAATGPFLAYVNLCKPLLLVSSPPLSKKIFDLNFSFFFFVQ